MPLINEFSKNGMTIEKSRPPAPMGGIGGQRGFIVGTAINKVLSVAFNEPITLYSTDDLVLLDTTGEQLGTLYQAAKYALEVAKVPVEVVVVEHSDTPETLKSNIIGKIDAQTGQRTGLKAVTMCKIAPTVISAPGFSNDLAVINAMVIEAESIYALVVADGPDTNPTDAQDLSETLGPTHERVVVCDVSGEVYSTAAEANVSVAPSVWGLASMLSVEPWKSPGNSSLLVVDVARTVSYRITSDSTEANDLNKYGICCPCRTTMGGFTFIGNRTVTGRFISHVGLENAIARKLEAAQQPSMAENMDADFFKMEVERLNNWLKSLKADGCLIDANVYLHSTRNNVESYRSGTWVLCIDYGPYSPNEHTIICLSEVNQIVETFVEDMTGAFANA